MQKTAGFGRREQKDKEVILEEMTLLELLEHLENMATIKERMSAQPVTSSRESKFPVPVDPELVRAIEQVRLTKAMILKRFGKAA